MLGGSLNLRLSEKHEILSLYHEKVGNCGEFNSLKIDLRNSEKLIDVVKEYSPDVVVHTAAVSNPAKADALDRKTVYDVNVNATKTLAEVCNEINAKLFYTSTDLVYAGYRGTMLPEDFKLVPISFYAETKLMGEIKIQETFENYVILRTSLLFGIGKRFAGNHFNAMYERLKKGEPVNLFVDQFRTPTSFDEAARIIAELVEKNITGEIVNFGGPEKVSRYELGEILCEEAGLDKNLLVKKRMEEIPNIYKVADVSMNTEKLRSFGIKQTPLREMIKAGLKI